MQQLGGEKQRANTVFYTGYSEKTQSTGTHAKIEPAIQAINRGGDTSAEQTASRKPAELITATLNNGV